MKTITVEEWNRNPPIGKDGEPLFIKNRNPKSKIRKLGTLKKYFTTYDDEEADLRIKIKEHLQSINSEPIRSKVVNTGFRDIDTLTGGLVLGEFVVVAGDKLIGKTQLLINFALNISQNYPVLYFSKDLSDFEIITRFMSTLSGVFSHHILQRNLTLEEREALYGTDNKLKNSKLFINDKHYSSMIDFEEYCEKQVSNNGIRVIIIDTVQLLYSDMERYKDEDLRKINYQLKDLAERLDICIIVACQLENIKERKEKTPSIVLLREFGDIKKKADKVIFIYRPEFYGLTQNEEGLDSAGLTELIVAKNTKGAIGKIKLATTPYFTSFLDWNE